MLSRSLLRMPGATLMTRLKVYDTAGPDGQCGGTPHMHLLCTELYFVLQGAGAVEMIDGEGFSRVELALYSALLFSPGTIHRLINPGSNLEILVIMANSGLPERGDNVVCFPETWLADGDRYAEAMRVESLADAYRRRDRGVAGFLALKAAFEQGLEDGRAALKQFYSLAAKRVASRRAEWAAILAGGALAEVEAGRQNLQRLDEGNVAYLLAAQHQLIPAAGYSQPGFCGHLNRYFDPATLTPEGISRP
ncbi:MAG: cupin domain-containing protein [Chloroflexi bacterium]|nr:cupin domain-containing protein [Chloroflexota bacterium]MCI0645417.1 cupin domain-containing protein [Chloroflexota bacterium]MCI0731283.1 cupin domain-containing protein [Chloroflexota bacterium]